MKVIVAVNNYPPCENDAQGWYLIADSAVTNIGKPFYKPDEYGKIIVYLAPAVKISRLGKSISPRFASRYYKEYAPALHFCMNNYSEKLIKAGLPITPAVSFDRSLFVGEFCPIERKKSLDLYLNGSKVAEWEWDKMLTDIDGLIVSMSRLNTMKIGDLILPGLSGFTEIRQGDILELKMEGAAAFQVKVK